MVSHGAQCVVTTWGCGGVVDAVGDRKVFLVGEKPDEEYIGKEDEYVETCPIC